MIKSIEDLRKSLAVNSIISREATDALLELDTLPSTSTQACLNSILVDFYNRLKDEEKVNVEAIDKETTTYKFVVWVNNNFTQYSANMFNQTISGK